jgi:UDP-N-acetylmuramate--alanine ligase
VEADEYDRSFLQLHPHIAVVTAIDPDHLEIYSNKENIISSFNTFISQVHSDGSLIINKKVAKVVNIPDDLKTYTYSLYDTDCDFYVNKKEIINGLFTFTLRTPEKEIKDLTLGIPGNVNLENAIAAIAASLLSGATPDEIKKALPVIKGVKRRFDILYRSENKLYIDDYAHHPEEIRRFLESLKEISPGKKISGVFQPHLFSRTRDFAADFAKSLSLLDKLYLLEIYPAREEPIPGVTSEIIFKEVTCEQKQLCRKIELLEELKNDENDILVTIGAGDIDIFRDPIVEILKYKQIEKV